MLRPLTPTPRLLLAAALTFAAALPAAAQTPSKSFLFQEKRFRNACRPPLKYAAGTCVRRCPTGYEDMGRTCRFDASRW